MNNISIYNLLKYAAIAGSIIYVLWILVNGITEGFRGTIVEVVSYIGLILLLSLNIILLY
jgi:hypothetical protein